MAFIYDLSDTWNAGATTFTAIKMNVTDTASAAGSKLIDLQVGGTTRFDVDKNGQVEISAGTALLPSLAALGDANTGMWFPAADTIAWSTGGSERMRIDSSGNVGIGTNAPAYRLDVQSSSDSFFRVKTTGTASAWFIGEAGAAGAVYYHNPSNTPSVITTNGSERVRITATGNVGVGTSSPDALLSVNGIASFGAGAAATPSIAAFGDLNTGMWFPAADTIAWSTNGGERLRITSAGSVGIGTSSPNTIFEVVQSTPSIVSRSSSATGFSEVVAASNDFFSIPSFAGTLLRHFGASATGTSYGISNAGLGSLIFQNANNALIATNGGTPLIFATVGVERLRITSTGEVGIGTIAPDARLSVNGIASFGAGAAATPSIAAFGDLNTGMWFPAADTIAWSTNGGERLRITSAGNVGIGTSSPSYVLDVVAPSDATSLNLRGRASDDIGVLRFATNANTERFAIDVRSDSTLFCTGTARTIRIRIADSGSVVINNAAIATTATDGFLYVPSCAGTPTGTPTTFTGRVPIVVDATNNKLYFYSGGQWRDAGP